MTNNCIHLGSFYWAEEVIPGVIANQIEKGDFMATKISVISNIGNRKRGNV